MRIAFWSNAHGLCGNTTHLGCVGIWYALTHPTKHCVIIENHRTPCGIDRMLYRPLASERALYYRSGGLGTLIRRVGNKDMSLLDLEFIAERFIGERLMYFPIGADVGPEQLDYHMEHHLDDIYEVLERKIDHIWFDTSSTGSSTHHILDRSDGIIVSISQNRTVLESLFSNHVSIHKKAFYLIGNYEADSDLSLDKIMRTYGIDDDRIAVIPRDVGLMDAVSRGALIPYIMQCYHSEIHEDSYHIASAMRNAMDKVTSWIGEEEVPYVYAKRPYASHTAMVAEGSPNRYGLYGGKVLYG